MYNGWVRAFPLGTTRRRGDDSEWKLFIPWPTSTAHIIISYLLEPHLTKLGSEQPTSRMATTRWHWPQKNSHDQRGSRGRSSRHCALHSAVHLVDSSPVNKSGQMRTGLRLSWLLRCLFKLWNNTVILCTRSKEANYLSTAPWFPAVELHDISPFDCNLPSAQCKCRTNRDKQAPIERLNRLST